MYTDYLLIGTHTRECLSAADVQQPEDIITPIINNN